MALPDFLVAGVPKAGTTALHAALSRHPGLYMSPIKEPKFFLTDGPPPSKGGPGDVLTYREHVWQRDRYEALFDAAPPGVPRGESTPLYLYDRAALRRIRDLVPAAKLVVILRDPVERAHSNWTHLWSAGLEPEADFVRACAEEERRSAAGWASFWHYTGLGKYGAQLDYAFSLFPREQVLVLRYRRLVDEPAATLDQICAFLGAATGIVTEIPRENVTAHPEHTLGHRAAALGMRVGAAAGRCFPATPRPRRRTGSNGSCSAADGNASRSAGSSGRRCCPGSRTTSSCSRRCSARTSATGCRRGRGQAAWSAPGPRGRARRRTAVTARPGQGPAATGAVSAVR